MYSAFRQQFADRSSVPGDAYRGRGLKHVVTKKGQPQRPSWVERPACSGSGCHFHPTQAFPRNWIGERPTGEDPGGKGWWIGILKRLGSLPDRGSREWTGGKDRNGGSPMKEKRAPAEKLRSSSPERRLPHVGRWFRLLKRCNLPSGTLPPSAGNPIASGLMGPPLIAFVVSP